VALLLLERQHLLELLLLLEEPPRAKTSARPLWLARAPLPWQTRLTISPRME
jgi:hypothetical protein